MNKFRLRVYLREFIIVKVTQSPSLYIYTFVCIAAIAPGPQQTSFPPHDPPFGAPGGRYKNVAFLLPIRFGLRHHGAPGPFDSHPPLPPIRRAPPTGTNSGTEGTATARVA